MTKYCFLSLFFSFLFLSCSQEKKENIILTHGLSENPQAKRVGFEITPDTIYYCLETGGATGKYLYYKSIVKESDIFLELKKAILQDFLVVNQDKDVVDGIPYELIYHFQELSDTFLFFRSKLSKKQNIIIDKINDLSNLEYIQSTYRDFPDLLLNETLPVPPAP